MQRKFTIAFLAVAGMALLSTVVNPNTRWLVADQVTGALGDRQRAVNMLHELGLKYEDMPLNWALPKPSTDNPERQNQCAFIAAQHPDDVGMQIAALAPIESPKKITVMRAHSYTDPAWIATILRFGTQGKLAVRNRQEEKELHPMSNTPQTKQGVAPSVPATKVVPVDKDEVRRFLNEAQAGERLDPQNAYFPLMETVALYALKYDTQAQAALHRAANCPTYDDYSQVEALGAFRLMEAQGSRYTLLKVARAASILYPHYSQFRSVSRLVTVQAMQKEQAGDIPGGLVLRADMIRVGEKIRDQARPYIGNLVGNAMVEIATSRPNGLPALSHKTTAEQEKVQKINEERWRDFVTQNGRPGLANTLTQNKANRTASAKIYQQAGFYSVFGMERLLTLITHHVAKSALFLMALGFAIIGIGSSLLSRQKNIQEGKAAPPEVCTGLWFSIISGAWLLGGVAGGEDALGLLALPYVTFLAGVGFLYMRKSELRKLEGPLAPRIGTLLATWITPLLILGLLFWLCATTIAPSLSLIGLVQGLSGGGDSEGMAGVKNIPYSWSETILYLSITLTTLALPFLVGVGLAIASKIRRVPVTVGVTRGMALWAIPLVTLLSISYALLLPPLAANETKASAELIEMTQGEISYLTKIKAQILPE